MVTASQRNAAAKKRTANARIGGRLGKNAPSTAEALRLKTKYAKASKKSNRLLSKTSSQKNSAYKKLQAAQKLQKNALNAYNKASNADMQAQFAATSNAQKANRYARSASSAVSARKAYNQGAKSALNSRTNATHGRLTRATAAARTAGALVRNHVIRPYHNAASISGYGW